MNEDRVSYLYDITEKLKTGVQDVFSSQSYQSYLSAMARFHTYSLNNTLLIYVQCPKATYVAGYQVWKDRFHRQVRKGEKAIRILAPVRRKKKTENQVREEYRLAGFRSAAVFDISQTEGPEVPVNLCRMLKDGQQSHGQLREALMLASLVPVHFEDIETDTYGFFRRDENDIVIRKGLSETQTVKTILHEMAHSMMHAKADRERSTREIEAESVAYAVSSYYGIDTSSYSFPYIAVWSKEKDISQLKESLDRIRNTSGKIISLVDTVLCPVPGSRNQKPVL